MSTINTRRVLADSSHFARKQRRKTPSHPRHDAGKLSRNFPKSSIFSSPPQTDRILKDLLGIPAYPLHKIFTNTCSTRSFKTGGSNEPKKNSLHSLCLATSFLAISGIVSASASSIELVQSYPIETTLQVPGVAQTQQTWLDIVNSATQTLDIEQYYINNEAGQSLDPIITAIKAAAARGVQVRFIIDSDFLKSNANEADCISTYLASTSARSISRPESCTPNTSSPTV